MKEIQHRQLRGTVVSDKMQKTVVVAVERLKLNEKYKKYFKTTKKFKAHDEKGEYHTGDKVVIEETRPMSKEKRWRVINKI
jgi:small subunit ribosomal protein S17